MSKGVARTRLYLVCSPMGSVGKTLTARLLLDYALTNSAQALGFDTNHLDPDFHNLFPHATSVVDLSSIRGQMEFFDRLVVADGAPKVVDLWHATYDMFWSQADSLGFFHEAAAEGVETVVFLLADRKDRFIPEITALPQRRPGLSLVLVHDEGLMKTIPSDKGRVAVVGAKRLLIVPEFDIAARRILAKQDTTIGGFLRAPPGADGTALESRAMLKRVFDQLAFLELSMARAAG